MKVTPLKKPITVTFDCVERAILCIAMMDGPRHAKSEYFRSHDSVPGHRLQSFNDALPHAGPGSVAVQLQGQLHHQGISWTTWEPVQPITIGSYTVEFKPGQIVVGCKTIANEVVRAILDRLENPSRASKTRSRAVVNIHGDKDLATLVVDAAKRNGFIHPYCEIMRDKAIILGGWYDSDASNLVQQSQFEWCKDNRSGKNITFLDARTQFGAVMDFLRNAKTTQPEIKVQGEPVKFENGSIQIEGHRVPLATVREIVKQLI